MGGAGIASAVVLSACGETITVTETKVQTVEVERIVDRPVEKVVTVIVEKAVEVERIVEVRKEVVVEKLVHPPVRGVMPVED